MDKEKVDTIIRVLGMSFNVEKTKQDGSIYMVSEPVVQGADREKLVAELTNELTKQATA